MPKVLFSFKDLSEIIQKRPTKRIRTRKSGKNKHKKYFYVMNVQIIYKKF